VKTALNGTKFASGLHDAPHHLPSPAPKLLDLLNPGAEQEEHVLAFLQALTSDGGESERQQERDWPYVHDSAPGKELYPLNHHYGGGNRCRS
jgi:hypothetical protein